MLVTQDTTIDAPIQAVFLFVEDIASYPQWSTGLKQASIDAEMPIRPGSSFEILLDRNGSRHGFHGTVTKHEPHGAFAIECTDDRYVHVVINWLLEDVNGRTHVSMESQAEFLKWYLNLLDALVLSRMSRPDVVGLEGLKAFAEKMWSE